MSQIDFSAINKATALSFKAQRKIITSLGRGDTVMCQQCSQPLKLTTVHKGVDKHKNGISCAGDCNNVGLEFVE